MAGIPNPSTKRSFTFRDALQGFLLNQELAFAELLDKDLVREVFQKHQSYFGGIFHTAIVLWAFMSQVLRDGKEASCQSAVARISVALARWGKKIPDANTGDYCKARAKLSEEAISELCCEVARRNEQNANPKWRWKKRPAYLIDGFTFQMPDTPKNQKEYPQHTAQKPGLGFPIVRVVALISLATGCLINSAMGRYKGIGTGETALFRQIFGNLKPGDVVVADRHYCSYWLICYLMILGVHVCFRKHQSKHTDFRKGKRLGKKDHIVVWPRSARPEWMSKEDYRKLPKEIQLREIGYTIVEHGRKQAPFVVVTTMIEAAGEEHVTREDLSSLYGFRWNVELDIRSIKSNMNLGFLRCKSPEMIRREFWTIMLAYNLIRATIALAAKLNEVIPRTISFTSACQYVLASWQEFLHNKNIGFWKTYCESMLKAISSCEVANRPGRFEPRVVKRRRDQYNLMTEPRNALRSRLSKGDNAFE
ncbi:MAG: IS4 family transposase [Pirellula sp.]